MVPGLVPDGRGVGPDPRQAMLLRLRAEVASNCTKTSSSDKCLADLEVLPAGNHAAALDSRFLPQ